MKKQDDFTFNGFEPANTTPVPDVLFDELLSQLTGAELKVLLYIIRRTKGFKKDTDAISLSQFQKGILTRDGRQLDKGCGIGDRQTIIDALASLEKKRCIVSEKGKTSIGDNAVTVYRICFRQRVVGNSNHLVGNTDYGSMENPTTVVDFSNHGSSENQLPVVGNSNPQETVLQDTDSQERVIPEESNGESTERDTFASAHSLDALSLSQSIDTESHQDSPIADSNTTPSEGEPHEPIVDPLRSLHSSSSSLGASDCQGYPHGTETLQTDTTGDRAPARRDVEIEGDTDHVPVPAPRHPHRVDNATAPGGNSGHAPVDDRHVAASEARPILEAGQKEEVNDGRTDSDMAAMVLPDNGHHLPGMPDCHQEGQAVEQTPSREDVPAVAASPLPSSTVEPGESEKGTLPVAPVQTLEDVKPERGKRSRKKKVDLDDVTQGRVNKVIAYLDKLKQEVMEDPAIKYRPTQTDTDAIVNVLLPQSPSEKRVRKVFFDMWNEKSRDGTYFWRKRMKIHNICNEYESRVMGLEGKDKEDSQLSVPDKDKTVGGYQFFQLDEVESTLSVMQA